MSKAIREQKLSVCVNEHRKKDIPVVDLNEFDSLSSGAVLVSKHGYCKHSYAFKPCEHYPIENSDLDNETISNIHDKILKRTLYDKNDGNINADRWYEFHKRIKKGE